MYIVQSHPIYMYMYTCMFTPHTAILHTMHPLLHSSHSHIISFPIPHNTCILIPHSPTCTVHVQYIHSKHNHILYNYYIPLPIYVYMYMYTCITYYSPDNSTSHTVIPQSVMSTPSPAPPHRACDPSQPAILP